MRYWDTSAIVPLCVDEPTTGVARRLTESDGSIVVWWGTRTEALSAVAGRQREGNLGALHATRARRVLEVLCGAWSEVSPSDALRERAERLLTVHPLRTADAFQLSAALLWCRGKTRRHQFVALDDRLREAALREGFQVLPT